MSIVRKIHLQESETLFFLLKDDARTWKCIKNRSRERLIIVWGKKERISRKKREHTLTHHQPPASDLNRLPALDTDRRGLKSLGVQTVGQPPPDDTSLPGRPAPLLGGRIHPAFRLRSRLCLQRGGRRSPARQPRAPEPWGTSAIAAFGSFKPPPVRDVTSNGSFRRQVNRP